MLAFLPLTKQAHTSWGAQRSAKSSYEKAKIVLGRGREFGQLHVGSPRRTASNAKEAASYPS